MLISEIKELLDARVLGGEHLLGGEVCSACGSDMMSDVLAFDHGHGVLVTGLVNPQVIRTAEMMDIKCIVFGRSKMPDQNMIDMAHERDIVLLSTRHGMLGCCGLLYSAGLREGGDSLA